VQLTVCAIEEGRLRHAAKGLRLIVALCRTKEERVADADQTLPTRVVQAQAVFAEAHDRKRRYPVLIEGSRPADVERGAPAHCDDTIRPLHGDVDPAAAAHVIGVQKGAEDADTTPVLD
jgi:hypothetical protein